MEFAHPSLWVSDINETRKFYEEILHLDVTDISESTVYHPGSQNLFLRDESGVELQFKQEEGQAPDPPSGFDHLAFSVENVDKTYKNIVTDSGCPVVLEPSTMEEAGLRIAFIRDPDGYKIELIEEL